ncbi:hypothetical protein QJS66_11975 [Kocuria rhizophila]|nr:hypothetical protein QJS66_11975 [Kocuria rhizophila]
MPTENVLPHAKSFQDTSAVLFATRIGVAWAAVGHAQACYEYRGALHQAAPPVGATSRIADRPGRLTTCSRAHPVQTLVIAIARKERPDAQQSAAWLAKCAATRAAPPGRHEHPGPTASDGILMENRVARRFADIKAIHTYKAPRRSRRSWSADPSRASPPTSDPAGVPDRRLSGAPCRRHQAHDSPALPRAQRGGLP